MLAMLAKVIMPASSSWIDRRFEHEPAGHGRQRRDHREPRERLPQWAIGRKGVDVQHIGTGDIPDSMRSRQDRLDRHLLRPRPCPDQTTKQEPRRHAADAAPCQPRSKPGGCSRTRRGHQEHEAGGVGGLGPGEPAGDRHDGGQQGTGHCRGHDFKRLGHTAGGEHAEHHADERPGGPLAGPCTPPEELPPAASGETDNQRDISDRCHRQHGGRQHGDAARLIRGCNGTPPSEPTTQGERDPRRRPSLVNADEQPKPARHCPPRCRKQPVHDATLIS